MDDRRTSTKKIVLVGMAAALLAILSQLSIPMPSGVPVTLQTFAVALVGVILYWKMGVAAVAVYILIGAVGAPVFANFNAGAAALVGKTGGFIWGFLFLSLLCGIGGRMKNRLLGIGTGLAGLALCHLAGVVQFAAISAMSLKNSFLLVSISYLPKDIFSVILSFVVGWQMRKLLVRASVLTH